jgi:hypothetical protein
MKSLGVLGFLFSADATYTGRVWTYQSTNRVDAMGMGYGVAYSMIGRGRHDFATGIRTFSHSLTHSLLTHHSLTYLLNAFFTILHSLYPNPLIHYPLPLTHSLIRLLTP